MPGYCCERPHTSHGLCRKCSEVSDSISSPGLGSFFRVLLQDSALTGAKECRMIKQINVRSKRDVLVPPYELKNRRSCCFLGNLGKNLGFG